MFVGVLDGIIEDGVIIVILFLDIFLKFSVGRFNLLNGVWCAKVSDKY